MAIVGTAAEWADLIDPMVPQILDLVLASWDAMPEPTADEREDTITLALCRALRQNRTARGLMFQIHTQQVELEPASGEELGRLDIVFNALVPREDIYFCLETKRLNVVKDGERRAYASEYVSLGVSRFITGQYSNAVQHGGMIAYVLDGDAARAIANVAANIRRRYVALCMAAPGTFLASTVLADDERARETHHQRPGDGRLFRLHHVFIARRISSGAAVTEARGRRGAGRKRGAAAR